MKREFEQCGWCDEPLLPHEERAPFGPEHYECSLRSIIGSLGHQRGLCSCYGGTEEDPPGMTRRQAAAAAANYFNTKRLPDEQ